ncbi:hypothetical protein AV530_006517 [Patagioenas fasciata monilis]|uniref:Uncharacterized protein n=1 Tax=Patagioenas fasciata monilis TaxID=372326 RepID=A0A1V4KGX3_PATFA|nr:hypothetical protein AV530_006517 [Patagioenas fasciata monilis]
MRTNCSATAFGSASAHLVRARGGTGLRLRMRRRERWDSGICRPTCRWRAGAPRACSVRAQGRARRSRAGRTRGRRGEGEGVAQAHCAVSAQRCGEHQGAPFWRCCAVPGAAGSGARRGAWPGGVSVKLILQNLSGLQSRNR